MTVLSAALTWASRGACVLPTRPDGTKAPAQKWKQYEWKRPEDPIPAPPSAQMMNTWFDEASTGLGLILGAVSGNLEMIELEGRAVDEGLLSEFSRLLLDNGLSDVWARLRAGYVELTPKGGLHFIYRVSDGRALRNIKLARRPSTEAELAENPGARIQVLIETRGEGGHVVIAPSHGPTHNSGKPWVVTVDNAPAELTVAERDQLFDVARMLNTAPVTERPVKTAWAQHGDTDKNPFAIHYGGISPLDDFESKVDWADILEEHGWEFVTKENETTYWLRPGKSLVDTDGWGWSASTGHWDDRDTMYVWSTSTELPSEQQMTKPFVYAQLNHDGDMVAAAAALREAGFGTPRRQPDAGSPERDAKHQALIDKQTARGYFLPDEFWNNTELPAFARLRTCALSRLAAPGAVLVAAMVRTVAYIGPQVVIPPWVMTAASLNFGAVIVGDSGASKSGSVGVADEALVFKNGHGESVAPLKQTVHTFCPSSPQGIAAQYQRLKKVNGVEELVTIRLTAICDIDEGDQLRAVWEKQGIGIIAELRKALMGKALGFGNVGETKTNLPAHAYRFGFLLCTLPTHADWIMGDDVGGFPQRLVWACAEDARTSRGVQWPKPFVVNLPNDVMLGEPNDQAQRAPRLQLTADLKVEHEVVQNNLDRIELGLAPGDLDGHAVLTREKVAWIFALMHGRTEVRYDIEWQAAKTFMESSNAVRAYVQGLIAEKAADAAHSAAISRGRVRHTEEKTFSESRDSEVQANVSRRIMGYLKAAPGISKSDLRRKFDTTTRPFIGDRGNPQVLDALLQTGQVHYENIEQHGKIVGSRWFLGPQIVPQSENPFA